jgi:predicted dehydrogenase
MKIRCTIIGMGGLGKAMVGVLSEKPWYQTAAVVDVRDEALEIARSELSLTENQVYTDLGEALDKTEADAAVINTPSELHYQQSKVALENGLNVLVAKPFTNDYDQAVELVDLARDEGLTISVGQQLRFNRHYQAVRRFLETDRLGRPELVNFTNAKPRHKARNLANFDHPALLEMSCHHFDSLMALFPEQVPEWIGCDGFRPSWSVYSSPCMVNALIKFDGGLHILYQGGFSSQANCYELRIEGTKGALRCRGIHMSHNYMEYEFAERGSDWGLIEVDEGIPTTNPFETHIDIWHEYIMGGPEPPFSGRNNLKVFALLSAGIDSVDDGNTVRVADNPKYANAFDGGLEWRKTGT